jgi:hypothetical protein
VRAAIVEAGRRQGQRGGVLLKRGAGLAVQAASGSPDVNDSRWRTVMSAWSSPPSIWPVVDSRDNWFCSISRKITIADTSLEADATAMRWSSVNVPRRLL